MPTFSVATRFHNLGATVVDEDVLGSAMVVAGDRLGGFAGAGLGRRTRLAICEG